LDKTNTDISIRFNIN